MNITVWSNFSKRINSTKQPAANTGTIKTVLLKDATDIEAPVFELNTVDFSINYVQAFGHYYFCDVRNLDGNRSELVCSMDHLATFKDQIKAYSGLVEYTSSSSNVLITDPRNRPTYKTHAAQTLFNIPWSVSGEGTYIVGVISDSAGFIGMTDYYAMTRGNLQIFCQKIFVSNYLNNLINDFNGVQNSLVSCIWLPFDYSWITSNFTGVSDQVHIGRDSLAGTSAYRLTQRAKSANVSQALSFPVGYTNDNYLRHAPYATGTLYLPFVGSVNLDLDIFGSDPSMRIGYDIDILTGDIIYYISDSAFTGFDALVSTYSGNCASKVPINGASYDGIGVGTGVVAAIGGAVALASAIATGGATAIMGGAAASVGGIAMANKSASLHSMTNGSMSSAIGALSISTAKTEIFILEPVETNLTAYKTSHGMPYFKVATLSSLSGYIQCADASVDIPGTAAEKTAVNGYLNSGFYLE